MRLILLFSLLFVSLLGYSQTLSFEHAVVEKPADPAIGDISAYNRIINSGNLPIRARWIREVNDVPGAWQSAICDTNQCYLPRIDSADFTIPANTDSPITPHIYPDGTAGSAQVTIRVIDIDDRRNNAVSTFSFPMITSSVQNPFSSGPKLYPNPATEEFSILSDVSVSEVSVSNMLGKLIKLYPGQSSSYDVSDLPNGIYLVSMKDSYGRIIKTLRFSKRSYRP
ncbi:MAG: T9SS type A sorting domain-containing protein [Saprospiraceae bacterium]